jgi:hypothetical protein
LGNGGFSGQGPLLHGAEKRVISGEGDRGHGLGFPSQHKVSRDFWTHCIEDIGVVRNQEFCTEEEMMVRGPHDTVSLPGSTWATFSHY